MHMLHSVRREVNCEWRTEKHVGGKAAVAYLKISHNHLPQGTEEVHENTQDIRTVGLDSRHEC